jgi:protein O-GlcNAc transferase
MDEAALERAVGLHRGGELTAAEPLYLKLIEAAPGHLAARHMLGVLRHQQGRSSEAAALIEAVLDAAPDWPDALVNHGTVLQAVERYEEAAAAYARALKLQPGLAAAHYGHGNALAALDRHAEALAAYEGALALQPDSVAALRDRANALFALDRHAEAVAAYDAALALAPDATDALNNRGTALTRLGRDYEALASFERALALQPDWPEALYNRAAVLLRLGRFAEAIAAADAALELRPDWPEALYNRAEALSGRMRDTEALVDLDRALALNPDWTQALISRSCALLRLSRFEEAMAGFERALELAPDDTSALLNAGTALLLQGRISEAVARYLRALELDPELADAHAALAGAYEWAIEPDAATDHYLRALELSEQPGMAWQLRLCLAQLPPLYRDAAEIGRRRRAYEEELERLSRQTDDFERRLKEFEDMGGRLRQSGLSEWIGVNQPFYLPYQGLDDRELQQRYGGLMCRIAGFDHPPAPAPAPPGSQEPVRLGIVSGFFRQHTVWKLLLRGWVGQIDSRKIRLFLYHTGVIEDGETAAAAARAERFVQGPLATADWRETILADRPHVLIYPEIGMDATCARLAAQRLAPVQCVAWGHPNTTGYPTLDYFLSSDLMEPPDAAHHYTERLVRLPGLSLYYEPLAFEPVALSRGELGLRPGATLYWCGQSLFKYLPQYDQVFARIASAVGDCQFVFFEFSHGRLGTDLFRSRLARAFAEFGLDAEHHCVVMPRADLDRFAAIIGECDIILDSIGWSGGNTTMESLAHALPIVTLPGPFMRGRHTSAILEMMGVTETIAHSLDDYVAIAVRLAHDRSWREAMQRRMADNRDRVYRDRAPVAALEEFLDRVARGEN